jgi:hypothetical protein
MGWGRYLLLGDLGQQLDLSDQKDQIESLRTELQRARATSGARADLGQLRAENDELRLYLAALIRLLTSKGLVSPDELKRIVETVDTDDGRRDGRFSGPMT